MHELKINIGNKDYNFQHPESYNELSEKQYLEVVKLYFLKKEDIASRDADRINLLFAMLGGFDAKRKQRKSIYNIINYIIKNEPTLIDELLKLQGFISTDKTFNTWKIPFIKIDKKHNGPDDKFNSMKFGVFIKADTLASAYFGAKKPERILNMLVEVLFNCDDASKLHDIPKFGILYNYLAIRNYLTEKYPAVFPKEKKKSKNITLGKQNNSWMTIRRQLAGSVLELKNVDNLNLHEVLADLNQKILNDD